MTITITAFADSPDQGAGLARDMIVRWALDEVGEPYDVRLVFAWSGTSVREATPRPADDQRQFLVGFWRPPANDSR